MSTSSSASSISAHSAFRRLNRHGLCVCVCACELWRHIPSDEFLLLFDVYRHLVLTDLFHPIPNDFMISIEEWIPAVTVAAVAGFQFFGGRFSSTQKRERKEEMKKTGKRMRNAKYFNEFQFGLA